MSVSNPLTVVARYSAASLGLKDPADLAIGPDGNAYVVDASQRVTVVSPHGTVVRRWGQHGKGPGQFDFIYRDGPAPGRPLTASIAVGPDGKVYVSDSGNGRVEVFSPIGMFIRQFVSRATGLGQFLVGPFGLTADSTGNVYVVDDGLKKFSPSGALIWRIGGASGKDQDLVGTVELSSSSIDIHGRIFLANDQQGRVVSIDAKGRKIDAFGEGSQNGSSGTFREGVCNVTVDATGHIFVTSCQEPLISPHFTEVFDRDHRLIGAWYESGIGRSPRFGPNGEVFTLGDDGSILRLKVVLPDA